MYEVRAALEPEMARLFAERATARDLKALEGAFRELEKTGQSRNVRAYVSAYDRFYEVLLEGSGNKLAKRFLRTLRARITRDLQAQEAHDCCREGTVTTPTSESAEKYHNRK